MANILIIKTGAAGDVARTTVLLNVLQAQITWVINEEYKGLLPDSHPNIDRIISLKEAEVLVERQHFDLVLSLEEDIYCATLASRARTDKLTGVYLDRHQVTYSTDSAGWFNMSLISKNGIEAANEAKKINTYPFQHWLLQMVNVEFSGERYAIYKHAGLLPERGTVGIESRVGERWPNKAWAGYAALKQMLEQDGYRVKVFSQKQSIREYLDDIATCSYIISGDTLAMHAALAYGIRCSAIFNCTSPTEIYDYGLLTKIVSPMLNQSYYSTAPSAEVIGSVTVRDVYNSIGENINKKQGTTLA